MKSGSVPVVFTPQILSDDNKRQQYDQYGRVDDMPQHRGGGRGGPVFDFGNGFRFQFNEFYGEGFGQSESMKNKITARFVCLVHLLEEALLSIMRQFSCNNSLR